MTRAKSSPAIHKPDFDVDGILRFAAQAASAPGHDLRPNDVDPKRLSLTLMLKPEVIDRLKAEAVRKDKSVDQIVEKLVNKHLNKH